jgi:hypothetical protein
MSTTRNRLLRRAAKLRQEFSDLGYMRLVDLDETTLPDDLVMLAPLAELFAVLATEAGGAFERAPRELREALVAADQHERAIYRFLGQAIRIPEYNAMGVASIHKKAQQQMKIFKSVVQTPEYEAFARLIEVIALTKMM